MRDTEQTADSLASLEHLMDNTVAVHAWSWISILSTFYCNSPRIFTGKQIILMGDFNINLLHYHSNTHAQNFILSLQSLNLTPTIDKPTRVNNSSYSLIDNIFINNLGYSICSGSDVVDL